MKFQLNGMQRDLVTSYAIHQDGRALIAFIEELVSEKQGEVFAHIVGPVTQQANKEVVDGKTVDGGTQAPAKK
jgi:hypothetical protein